MQNIHSSYVYFGFGIYCFYLCVFCTARAARKITQCRKVNGKVELRPAILACRYFRRAVIWGGSTWRILAQRTWIGQ